jgi:hypothetical protein
MGVHIGGPNWGSKMGVHIGVHIGGQNWGVQNGCPKWGFRSVGNCFAISAALELVLIKGPHDHSPGKVPGAKN